VTHRPRLDGVGQNQKSAQKLAYTGYGPIRAGAWGALDPNDELVNQPLAFLKKRMPKGLGHHAFPDMADANWGDIVAVQPLTHAKESSRTR
jgi:hypothetical protein